MNPLRALFLSLSRMPPAVMLLIIIGLAVVVTMMVTGKVSEQEKTFQSKQAELEQKMNAKGKVVYTIKDIPEGQTIPTEALEEREIEQSKIPQDAITSASLAAGRVAKYVFRQVKSCHSTTWLLKEYHLVSKPDSRKAIEL